MVSIGLVLSEEKIFEKVYDVRRTDDDDGRQVIGSGELIIYTLGAWFIPVNKIYNSFPHTVRFIPVNDIYISFPHTVRFIPVNDIYDSIIPVNEI